MSCPVAVATAPLVRVHELSQTFGANRALDRVSLEIFPGQVLALLGACGAGKSTVAKILGGSQWADGGEVWVDGQRQRFVSPLSARRVGIVAVQQQVNHDIAPGLTVAENLLLDELYQPGADFWLNRKSLLERAAAIAAGLGLDLPLQHPIERLGPAGRQLVVLARALALQPRVLILDEPTALLSDAETRRLFGLIDSLRSRGVAILYITRCMSEVQGIADRAVVLCDGCVADDFSAGQWPTALKTLPSDVQGRHVHAPEVCSREVSALRNNLMLPFLERFTRGGFIRNRAEALAVEKQVAARCIKTADAPGDSPSKHIAYRLRRWSVGRHQRQGEA